LTSRPSRFIASIVGSSWKSADSSGLAARLERLDVRGQVLDPAGRRAVDEPARGLEVAVEVVDPDDLHVDGPAPDGGGRGRAGPSPSPPARR
jgi:hypothetical protein